MKYFANALLSIGLVTLLMACTTPSGLESTGSQSGSTISGADTTTTNSAYDTRSGTDTFGYDPNAPVSGDAFSSNYAGLGGPNASIESRTIYFDFDSVDVKPASRPVIEAQAGYLLSTPGAVAILEGHADERGTREYNIGLGDKRSATVRRLLIALGVSQQQIQTVSYGEERPANAGRDEGSYGLNRRVEFAY